MPGSGRGIAQIGIEVRCRAFAGAREQGPGMYQHHRVIVCVDDPRFRATACAASWVLLAVGSPVPMSRNWRTPHPDAR